MMVFALLVAACGGPAAERKRIEPVYDSKTGKLQLLKYDADGDGKVDTLSHMDGARVVRIDIDQDEDGKTDRWEYYDSAQKLEKVGFSRSGDGQEDAWSYTGPDGAIVRIDVSTRRDGKVSRVERYAHDLIVSADEDTDGDGKTDKWETYEGERLTSVAFDTTHRGTPDRRLIYGPQGTARLEVDLAGNGHFVAVTSPSSARAPRPTHK